MTPAAAARIRLSTTWSRTRRKRLAPSAARMTRSRWRAAARASIRLATFAQAISRTSATIAANTAAKIGTNPDSAGSGRARFSAITRMRAPLCSAGNASATRRAATSISARASATVRPGASRPISRHAGAPRLSRNSLPLSISVPMAPDGTHALTATAHDKPEKLAGAMAVTVKRRPFREIARPTSDGSPPNRRCQ